MSIAEKLPCRWQIVVPRNPRFAIAAMFFISGVVSGDWVACIPQIQQKLELSNGALAFALLGMPIGLLLVTPLIGWLIARVGSCLITKIAALTYCLALPLPVLAPQLPVLAIALVLFGAINGAVNLAMNAQGVAIEQRYRRPFMSSFHGMASVGGLVGVAIGGILVHLKVPLLLHLLCAALLLGMMALFTSRRLLPSAVVPVSHKLIFVPKRSLIGLGIVAFCSMLGEGAMANWSSVYLNQAHQDEPGLAVYGYVAFSLAMACGRFTGDRVAQHFVPAKIVGFSGTLAAIGLILFLAFPQQLAIATIGAACVGIGLSSIVPLVFSAAACTPGLAPSISLAAVTTTGSFGSFGSPLIGLASNSLALGMSLVVVSSATIALLAPIVFRSK